MHSIHTATTWQPFHFDVERLGMLMELPAAAQLTFYHGAALQPDGGRCYQTGELLLDPQGPRRILIRPKRPMIGLHTAGERHGVVNQVVFATTLDQDRGTLDVYYGMGGAALGWHALRSASPV